MNQIIAALESYHASNGTYKVSGGGHNGNGNGWAQSSTGSYPDSVTNILQSLGYLDNNFSRDPLFTETGARTHDFMIYRCNSRVGVFSNADTIQAPVDDQTWWSDNDCPTTPISRYQHTYFRLSNLP